MSDEKKLSKAFEALETAESALKLAKQVLSDITGLTSEKFSTARYTEKAAGVGEDSTTGRVIQGVFDGQNMVDAKGTVYPVPANYASKSKLIPGDILKLTVTEEGKFLYKQIGPVERKTEVGPLVYNEGQYQVLTSSKAYNVLLASVTYFRAQVGDEVTLIIPMNEESDWGAIEAALPKFEEEVKETPVPSKKTDKKKVKDELDIEIEEELDI